MSHAVLPTEMPSRFDAGDSLSWKVSDSAFPATEWDLVYTLVNADNQIQITATDSGTDHLVEINSTDSEAFAPGEYTYQCHVSKDDERHKLDEGVVTIGVNFSDASDGHDARSHAKKTLDALEALIEDRASKAQQEHSYNGRQIKYYSLAELKEARRECKMEYAKERARANGRPFSRTMKPRFVN